MREWLWPVTRCHEAVKWYRLAAEQGLAAGQYGLGMCLADGVGVAKDMVEAVTWLRAAAAHGPSDLIGAAAIAELKQQLDAST